MTTLINRHIQQNRLYVVIIKTPDLLFKLEKNMPEQIAGIHYKATSIN